MTDQEVLKLVEQAQRHMDSAAQIFNEISESGFEVDASFRRINVTTLGDLQRHYVYAPVVEITKVIAR